MCGLVRGLLAGLAGLAPDASASLLLDQPKVRCATAWAGWRGPWWRPWSWPSGTGRPREDPLDRHQPGAATSLVRFLFVHNPVMLCQGGWGKSPDPWSPPALGVVLLAASSGGGSSAAPVALPGVGLFAAADHAGAGHRPAGARRRRGIWLGQRHRDGPGPVPTPARRTRAAEPPGG